MDDFYHWLVARNIEAYILGEVAAAVVSDDVADILDVSLAQMFLSRANQRHDVIILASMRWTRTTNYKTFVVANLFTKIQ